jgi:hypothetical protein
MDSFHTAVGSTADSVTAYLALVGNWLPPARGQVTVNVEGP